jgi:hypothetical protein
MELTPRICTKDEFINFGRDLIITEDLDPLYVGVFNAALSRSDLAAFLLTYWMFYNAGFSAMTVDRLRAAGAGAYWEAIARAAGDLTRRGTERRHFRGQKAVNAVATLSSWYADGPEEAVDYIASPDYTGISRFTGIMERAQKWPQFGPWIAFKAADMIDCCGYNAVDSTGCDLAMYKTPVAGAELYAQLSAVAPHNVVRYAVNELELEYIDLYAPPKFGRRVGIFEIETVLCKTKSAAGGHYHLGKDTVEIRHMLSHSEGPTAAKILKCMPHVVRDDAERLL